MRAYERFLEYVSYDTASDPTSGHAPSSEGQLVFARVLGKEMAALGFRDLKLEKSGILWGTLPATPGCEGAPALGLLAHLDTSPDAPGVNVRPMLHPVYDGGNVSLPGGGSVQVEQYPHYKKLAGQTLITSDGTTLLGADDKAGIAEILTACDELINNGLPHGKLCVAFTPDEEIGGSTEKLDLMAFGADIAYTVDGGEVGEIEYENFNAASATVTFEGVGVHPGEAKDIMVNAAALATAFHCRLPADEVPEKTEDRQGFFHLHHMEGTVERATLSYLIRDHDHAAFEARKRTLRDIAAAMNAEIGAPRVQVETENSYHNMAEVVEKHFHLVENAQEAIKAAGLTPISNPIRGGTDGAMLSLRGLPCPNLGTGGFYFHGLAECISAEAMDKAVEVLLGIIARYAECA